MAKLIVELIGTFVLVLTVGMTVIDPGAGALAPLAIGLALMVVVYAGGHVSGAHYNPAVSLAVLLRGGITFSSMLGYWVAQVAGGVLAIGAVIVLKQGGGAAAGDLDPLRALLAEAIFTFVLCFVVLNTATAAETAGNSFYGLAIGLTVTAGVYAVGSISGGVFNPAVAMGVVGLGIVPRGSLWIYLVAALAGAAAAAAVFRLTHPEPAIVPLVAEGDGQPA
jgi:aquaporin Z